MKQIYKLLAIALLAVLGFLSPHKASASHFAAWDMSYQYIGNDSFAIRLTIYYDCAGIPPATQESICVKNNANASFTVSAPGTDRGIITPSCITDTITACNSPTSMNIGFRYWTYDVVVAIPVTTANIAANQWTFSWTNSARNNAIQNLVSPGSTYAEAFLDNNILPHNNSAVFNERPVPYRCVGKPVVIQQGVTDIDGDSLVFSLIAARAGIFGCPISATNYQYVAPYSPTYPNPATQLPILSQVNGDIYETAVLPPNATQFVAVYAINCKELRQGNRVGEVNRDMQVIFKIGLLCDTSSLTISSTSIPFGTFGHVDTVLASCLDTSIMLKTSQPFLCNTLAADGSDFRVVDAITHQNIPIKSATGLFCGTNSVSNRLFLKLYNGGLVLNRYYYVLSKVGNDNNTLVTACGLKMNEFDTLAVVVNNCYQYNKPQDMVNVTVNPGDTSVTLYWRQNQDTAINPAYFSHWNIYRQPYITNKMELIDIISNLNATSYVHSNATAKTSLSHLPVYPPSEGPSRYAVTMTMRTKKQTPMSDSIRSIYLSNPDNSVADTGRHTAKVQWTSFWGWDTTVRSQYRVELQKDFSGLPFGSAGLFFPAVGDTAFQFTKPGLRVRDSGCYVMRIVTRIAPNDSTPEHESVSNTLKFCVPYYAPIPPPPPDTPGLFPLTVRNAVVIPNIFTPNGDGINDVWVISHLSDYSPTKVSVINRWGQRVYENKAYQNDWNGSNLTDGEYYYIIENVYEPTIGTRKGWVRIQR